MSHTVTVDLEALDPLLAKLKVITDAFAERVAQLAEVAEGYHHFHADLLARCADLPALIPFPTRRAP